MERDRETIGLTPASQAILADLEDRGWFAEGQDAARFSMAYAIRAGVEPGATSGTDTRWAAGGFDKSGEIRALLSALYPDCQIPIRLMEHLVNEGLALISERLKSPSLGPGDLMDIRAE